MKNQLHILLFVFICLTSIKQKSLAFLGLILFIIFCFKNSHRYEFNLIGFTILFLGLLLSQINIDSNLLSGRVVKVTDSTITIQKDLRKQCFFTYEPIAFDSYVSIEVKENTLFGNQCVSMSSYTIDHSPRTYLFSLYSTLDELDLNLLKSFIFPAYATDEVNLLGIMFITSTTLKSFEVVMSRWIRLKFTKENINIILLSISLFYCYWFGLSIGLVGLLVTQGLNIFNIERKTIKTLQLWSMYIASGMQWTNIRFLYPYLISFISNILNHHPYQKFSPIIIQTIYYGQVRVLDFIIFKMLRFFCGYLYLFLLLFFKITPFVKMTDSLLHLMINNSLILERIKLVGKWSPMLIAIFVVFLSISSQKTKKISIICALVFHSILMFYKPYFAITFINVGQGDAILIQYQYHVILIDTGKPSAYYQLKKTLIEKGVFRIDQLIITHHDSDHDGNIENLERDFEVIEIADDKSIELYTGISLIPLLDDITYDDANGNSRIIYLSVQGFSFLLTGDAGVEQEMEIIKQYPFLKVDVLKLGHHGSRTSTSLDILNHLQPSYAIISSLSSTYGHPHIDVLANLDKTRTYPILTEIDGNITFIITTFIQYYRTESAEFGIMI